MPLQVHILDIVSRDQKVLVEDEETLQVEFLEHDSSDDEGFHKKRPSTFTKANEKTGMILHIFGSTVDGQPVRIDMKGFKPFFYIRVPEGGSLSEAKEVIRQYLKENLNKQLATDSRITIDTDMREVLFEFTNGEKFPFLKITVPSLACYRAVRNLFLDSQTQLPATQTFGPLGDPFNGPPRVYEANLDPMLRFLHLQDLAPCGWVEFETLEIEDLEKETNGTLTGECEHNEVIPCTTPPKGVPCAPFLIASWDIECFSKSGDFPIAGKKYGNVIKPLLEAATSASNFGTRFIEAVFGSYSGSCGEPTIPLTGSALKQVTVERTVFSERFLGIVADYLKNRSDMKVADKSAKITEIGEILDKAFGKFAVPKGDPAIQIGVVLRRLGQIAESATERHIFVLGDCAPIDNVIVHAYKTEARMILGWCDFIAERNPDILTGYNVFGFDERYLWDRALELGLVRGSGFKTEVVESVLKLSRLAASGGTVRLEEKFLSSSALGDNFMYIISTQGRLQIDLYNYVKRNFNLPSYKLDEVTKNFLSGKHKSLVVEGSSRIRLNVGKKTANEVGIGRSVVFLDELGESLTEKLNVVAVEGDELVLNANSLEGDESLGSVSARTIIEDAVKWVVVKDDVSPQELFKLHQGSAEDRAKIGRYCVQDCELVLDLFKKLDVFNNAMSMANVCSVPVNYIFSRGQGIKCESLIFKFCHRKNQTIEVLPAPKNRVQVVLTEEGEGQEAEDSYEGAIVLEPKAGFYTESPIGVCDFASLYPSTIISENISHDSLVWIRDYNDDGTLIEQIFGGDKYDNIDDGTVAYTDIEFDLLRADPADTRKNPTKLKVGTRVCRYAQGRMGTIPEILEGLLAKRKATRELIKRETDPFRIALLDAEQNAYKITANSLYGQLGSGTFKVRLQSLAASVTAYGRKQILFAKAAIEKFYNQTSSDTGTQGRCCSAEIVYGDTDSLFISFNLKDPITGKRLEGHAAVEATIRITEEAGKFVSSVLKKPHDFEFDKVYWPFLILSKKRYIGNKYEEDADHFSQAFMGVALKRRDYAQIVKTIYGGVIKILLNQRENPVPTAIEFVRRCAMDLVQGRYGLGQLLISKSLRADYANPMGIAHKVLADRITARDPGNAPAAGDRISFVYVASEAGKTAPKLQGERIETPGFMKAKGLSPDYLFYIEHQIANPICQIFGLLLDKFPEYSDGGSTVPEDSATREAKAYELLFGAALQVCDKQKKTEFFRLFGSDLGAGATAAAPRKKVAAKSTVSRTPVKSTQTPIDTYFADMSLAKTAEKRKKKAQKEKQSESQDGAK